MTEKRFSFKKELKDSISNLSNSINSNNSLHFNPSIAQKNINRRMKYFEIYKQVKEEMLKNNNESKKANTVNISKRQGILDNMYIKNTSQINDYYNKHYNSIEIKGTKELEGKNKKDILSQIKSNQNNFIQKMPLKYRNPELNKNCEKVNCTPIPFMPNKETMYNFEKEEFDNTLEKAVFIRKMEYTHAHPPIDKKNIFLNKFTLIKKAKLIQKWYRFIRNNRRKYNNKIKKNDNININKTKKIDSMEFYHQKQEMSFGLNNNDQYKGNSLEEEYSNNKLGLKINNQNKDDFSKLRKQQQKIISFQILNQKNLRSSEISDTIIKPINNNCYISKGLMILINNSKDMENLNLIQKKIKLFLRNRNQISPYKLYKQMKEKKISKNSNKKNIKTISINSSEIDLGEIINISENVFEKKRIISKLDSLQSIHNLSVKDNENMLSNKLLKDFEDYNLNINDKINNNSNNDDIDSDSNLLNFSFNSDKTKKKIDNDKVINIKKYKKCNKDFFISKIIYYDYNDLICRIKFLQNYIRKYLHHENKRNKLMHSENSSEISDIYEFKKKEKNDYKIENNFFNLNSNEKSAKEKILKILLNKYNKKLNKEVDNTINIYYNKNSQKNQIMKISKNKLAIVLVKIIKNYLKEIFNNVYNYKSINYKREYTLLKCFNNIISRLRRYFFRWSNRPLKLLIYKSKSVKYYNSLIILNNNIKRLIKSIYNIFISRYYYILIINYSKINNDDIMNSKMFLSFNNKYKMKLFFEIYKNINQNKSKLDNDNNLDNVKHFKETENLHKVVNMNNEKIDNSNNDINNNINKEKENNNTIGVKFLSQDQSIDFLIACKTSDPFSLIESRLYRQYPDLENKDITFTANGIVIDRAASIEKNKIKHGNCILIIENIDDDNNEKIDVEERIITLHFCSTDQKIKCDLNIKYKPTYKFTFLLETLFLKYPNLINRNNIFLVNGNLIDTSATIQKNKIKDGDSIIIVEIETIIILHFVCFDFEQKIYIKLNVACYISDKFSIVEDRLYQEYPDLKNKDIFFLLKGYMIDRDKTLEENGIEENKAILICKILNDE